MMRHCQVRNSPRNIEPNNCFLLIWMLINHFLDFPNTPTKLQKSMLPVEVTSTEVTSDNENDKSVYEAHLSSNLQKVSLKMNEKEGRC